MNASDKAKHAEYSKVLANPHTPEEIKRVMRIRIGDLEKRGADEAKKTYTLMAQDQRSDNTWADFPVVVSSKYAKELIAEFGALDKDAAERAGLEVRIAMMMCRSGSPYIDEFFARDGELFSQRFPEENLNDEKRYPRS